MFRLYRSSLYENKYLMILFYYLRYTQAKFCRQILKILSWAQYVTILTMAFLQTANGQWNQWGHWSGCSKSCDGGWERRMRICQGAAVTGQQCEGTGEEVRRCSEQRCPGEKQISLLIFYTIKYVFQLTQMTLSYHTQKRQDHI